MSLAPTSSGRGPLQAPLNGVGGGISSLKRSRCSLGRREHLIAERPSPSSSTLEISGGGHRVQQTAPSGQEGLVMAKCLGHH